MGGNRHYRVTTLATLQDAARANRNFWGVCRKCGRVQSLNTLQMAERLGRNAELREIMSKLRCKRCKTRHGLLVLKVDEE